jgi:hypothetical protein
MKNVLGDEEIFIFDKLLEGWPIYILRSGSIFHSVSQFSSSSPLREPFFVVSDKKNMKTMPD